MKHGAFAYTWDVVGDPAAPERLAELGIDTVTLQAAYHSVRATTAWHPQHRVVHAQHAAAYFRLRPQQWSGQALRPLPPAWGVADDDRLGTATAALTAVGLRVEAWLVLTHSSAVGRQAPDLTVRTAFGDRHTYALCPAQPAVRDYALTLVAEVCAQYDVPALVLEACGWLGFEHGSHHEKTAGADLSACTRDLLSICLCAACCAALARRDVDTDRLAADVRALVDGELRGGGPAGSSLTEALGVPRAQALYDHRAEVISGLVREAAAIAGTRELLVMATDDPQVTGPDVGLDFAGMPADAFVLKCWGDEEEALAGVKAAAARTDVPLVANVSVLEDRPEQVPALVARLVAAGATRLRYYHAGLASPARLAAIRRATSEGR